MLPYIRLELRRLIRMPGLLIFAVLMPLLSYLLFTNLTTLTGQDQATAATYAMVSMAAYGAIGALLNYASGLVLDRSIGWLRQLRLTPLPPVKVVLGKGVTALATALVPVLALCGAAVAINGVSLRPGQWLALVPLLWLGSFPFALLGIGLGCLATAQTVQPLNLLVYLGLSIAGGLWLPLDIMPGWLAAVGRWLPTHAYADMAWRVAFGGAPTATDVLTLAAWLVPFTALAVFGYRRSTRSVAVL
ncbi:ABC transporter permease [Dactylosporangium sp. AC04546]|uniref:ABC transporter permease n=1 Tax=Dactylosporangium sp. AC04546 TaxID=2862460 RepID=UPI001EE0687C|nr:ABC transporter permease [Dactylosporangium sp. AC04546]WVK81883.1 ABC transporter permease [Dactylosporangium sp. AC04546]